MLDFEEELRKFHPSMEVGEIEDALLSKEITDIADALINIMDKKSTGDKK